MDSKLTDTPHLKDFKSTGVKQFFYQVFRVFSESFDKLQMFDILWNTLELQ